MTFFICVKDKYRDYFLKVERVHLDERNERFKISGKNKSIVVENNRPLFRNKGLMHRRVDWKLIEGSGSNMSMYEQIIEALMQAIE